MTLFVIIMAIVLSQEIETVSTHPKFSRRAKIESFSREAFTNSSNTSAACHFKISRSSLKDILKLMRDDRTNIIELDVWIKSANNTKNRSLVMTDVQWANEIGRTLYSLMLQTVYPTTLISSVLNITLAAGVRHLSVTVFPENEKCLLFQNHTSDNVFSDLLNQLYRASDEGTVYQLCHTHNLTLNCCVISAVGEKDIQICFDYSSIANAFPTFLFLTTPLVLTYVIIFVILIHFSKSLEKSTHYRISDSPMSLSSIIHDVLIVEHGAVLSSGKKLWVAFLVIATVLPVQNIAHAWFPLPAPVLYCIVCSWVFFYVFCNFQRTSESSNSINPETSIRSITLPFNLKLWWKWVLKIKTKLNRTHLIQKILSSLDSDLTDLLPAPDNNQPQTKFKAEMSECGKLLKQFWKLLICRIIFVFLLVFYLVVTFPLSCCVAAYELFYTTYWFPTYDKYLNQLPRQASCYSAPRIVITSLSSTFLIHADAFIALLCVSTLVPLLFHLAVGLFLNGQTFSPYFVLISTILLYAWSNWRSTVETKYLELNTTTCEVCDEITSVQSPTRESENVVRTESTEERNEGVNNDETSSNGSPEAADEFSVRIEKNGEIAIPTDLYELVRKKFLPYDVLLFHYFVRVLIVLLFAYFLHVLVSLCQSSGISNSVKALTSISGTMLPTVFNFVWRTNTTKQDEAEVVALKSKLKRVLQAGSRTDEEIKVKFIES